MSIFSLVIVKEMKDYWRSQARQIPKKSPLIAVYVGQAAYRNKIT